MYKVLKLGVRGILKFSVFSIELVLGVYMGPCDVNSVS